MRHLFGEQANAIRLESVLQRKIRSQSYWCGRTLRHYLQFFEKLNPFEQPTNNLRNACSFACVVNAEQATFWHSFAFASVPHALFAYRCGHAFRQNCVMGMCTFQRPLLPHYHWHAMRNNSTLSHKACNNSSCITVQDVKSLHLLHSLTTPRRISKNFWSRNCFRRAIFKNVEYFFIQQYFQKK